MSKRISIGAKPSTDPAAEGWIRRGNAEGAVDGTRKASPYTARLTIDVTPALRGRLKVRAFQDGVTVADMVRAVLEREFSEDVS